MGRCNDQQNAAWPVLKRSLPWHRTSGPAESQYFFGYEKGFINNFPMKIYAFYNNINVAFA